MALVAESDLSRYFRYFDGCREEEFLGALHTASDQVLVRRGTHRALEESGEVERTEPGDSGECFKRDLLGEMLLDEVQNQPERASAQSSGILADRLLKGGVVSDQMDGQCVGERLSVTATSRVPGLDFGAEGQGQSANQGVFDRDLSAELKMFGLNHFVGGSDQKARIDRDDEEVPGVPVANGDRTKGWEEADSAGWHMKRVGLAFHPLLETRGSIELDHNVMVQRGLVRGVRGSAGELLDGESAPRATFTCQHGRARHMRTRPTGREINECRGRKRNRDGRLGRRSD